MQWKDIDDYVGKYQISDTGLVKSFPSRTRQQIRILKIHPGVWGYARVVLCKDGKSKSFHISHLVANSFIGKRPDGKVVNHKDGNKLNNCYLNLEYIDPRENYVHAVKNGLTGKNKKSNRLKEEDKTKMVGLKNLGFSQFEISKIIGFHYRTVLRFFHGRSDY